ncbi:MAG TPA: aldo/keto reductase [Candidatus Acidoferrales bacterium]|nr:aldo/keto reductase [Candidatus Acidoferrales bacterium]
MQHKEFGWTKRAVPRIGQGTWKLPSRGAAVKEAERALRRGIELGMTHIDSAEMYGDGRSEEIVGDAIKGVDRSRLFVVSKVLPQNASYEGTIRACEHSLARLKTDYLDVYLLHWRGSQPLRDTMRALERLLSDGKIKALGVSNFDVEDLREATSYLEHGRIACNQVLYNFVERGIEYELTDYCRDNRIAIVGYTPFGGIPAERTKARVKLAEIAGRYDVNVYQLALAWCTRDPICFTIPKSADVVHVEQNARAGDLELDAEALREIDEIFPPPRKSQPLAMG